VYIKLFSENLTDGIEPVVSSISRSTEKTAEPEDRLNVGPKSTDKSTTRDTSVNPLQFEVSLPPPQLTEVKLLKSRFEVPPASDNSRPVKVTLPHAIHLQEFYV
jgi:hypothetical protein